MSAPGGLQGLCPSPAAEFTPKVKREQLESPLPPPPPPGPAATVPADATSSTTRPHSRSGPQQAPTLHAGPNGFRSAELLHDILKPTKYNGPAHHGTAAKHDKIRLMIEDSLSQESRSRVQDIFSQVDQLRVEEKLLLYLKLPASLTNPNGTVDPLRQPLNPLGNRYEIHQTIMWIKTHLEEDPEVSLPKQEVYDEYNIFCLKNSMKPLSTADFGKVMKQVYPRVRPRRLGTRGNSRYCYAGMRKRLKLNPPMLPSASGLEEDENAEHNTTEEMLGAASTLIREWAESLLGAQFPSLCALGKYLVNNFCVDNQSLAAVCVLSGAGEAQSATNKVSSPGLPVPPVSSKTAKLREAQLQLQKKLQQREYTRDQNDGHVDCASQEEKREKTGYQSNDGLAAGKKGKKGKTIGNHLAQGTNAFNTINLTTVGSNGRQKKVLKSSNQSCSSSLQSNCDNLVVQLNQDEQDISIPRLVTNGSAISTKEAKSKCARKRTSVSAAAQITESSPEKQVKLEDGQGSLENNVDSVTSGSRLSSGSVKQSPKLSVILACSPKSSKSIKTYGDAAASQTSVSCDVESAQSLENQSKSNGVTHGCEKSSKSSALTNNQTRRLNGNSNLLAKQRLKPVDSDSLNDYLNGGNNSQEQEEELLQYFQQSNSSSSDMELSGVSNETDVNSRQDKVSQLRMILQENLNESVLADVKPRSQSVAAEKPQQPPKQNLILPTLLCHNNVANLRRRVSFESNTVDHSQENGSHANSLITNTVPQSPNTRRRIFNFTPISPGPHSPINGRVSKCSSANASPFVSPRNTPVLRSRSNMQGSCRSRSSQKILSRSVSCNVPCSNNRDDTATFIVPTTCQPDAVRFSHSPLVAQNRSLQVSQQIQSSPVEACAPFLADLSTQEPQLLINYPSQENLQEIKNVHQKTQPTDQEISHYLQNETQYQSRDQFFYRSQSVPLHRMVNPALLSPISTHHLTPNFFNHNFNTSNDSSIAPTPVPSEYNDFCSMNPCDNSNYLLDVDPLTSTDQQFLIEDKEITPENLNNIFDILTEQESSILQHASADKQTTLDVNSLVIPNENLSDNILLTNPSALINPWPNGNALITKNNGLSLSDSVSKMLHSRSYPNTPLPLPATNTSIAVQYSEEGNGSKSYPATPIHNLRQEESYAENNEPMLFNPNLSAPSFQNQTVSSSTTCSTSVECSVADFLDRDLTNDGTDDLGSLGNFDGLQDVGALSPLFTEVVETNY